MVGWVISTGIKVYFTLPMSDVCNVFFSFLSLPQRTFHFFLKGGEYQVIEANNCKVYDYVIHIQLTSEKSLQSTVPASRHSSQRPQSLRPA